MKNTFTYGTTPERIIRNVLTKTGKDQYYMSLVGDDALLMQQLVNQGIDSHLEAITTTKPFGVQLSPFGTRLHCYIDHNGMVCLLRRLAEENSDNAMHLRTDILSTLGIEEV